jgi:putative transposase
MRKAYKTDLTDGQWELVRPLLPPVNPKTRAAHTDLREVVNTIFYQTKTGVQWDLLPHDLLPKSTVSDYYRRWLEDGTWQRLLDALREAVRVAEGRHPEPSAAVADSQSVPIACPRAEAVAFDGGKKVKGRKRHILVDVRGLLLAVVVTAANVSDGRAAPALMGQPQVRALGRLRKVFGDGRYNDNKFKQWLKRNSHVELGVVERAKDQKGFKVLKKRWVVERTFAWLLQFRRLSREYERTTESSEARVKIAMIQLMLKRLAGKKPKRIAGEAYATPQTRKVA